MGIVNQLTVLDGVLVTGIIWMAGVLIWVIKRYMTSYNSNTIALVTINKTLISMDQKLLTATEVDRDILVELARLKRDP